MEKSRIAIEDLKSDAVQELTETDIQRVTGGAQLVARRPAAEALTEEFSLAFAKVEVKYK